MLNVVAIMGRLVADPELKTTPASISVCTFRIACDRNFVQQGQQRQADFIDVVAWRHNADFLCKYFAKGSMVAVQGHLQTRQYQDRNGSRGGRGGQPELCRLEQEARRADRGRRR